MASNAWSSIWIIIYPIETVSIFNATTVELLVLRQHAWLKVFLRKSYLTNIYVSLTISQKSNNNQPQWQNLILTTKQITLCWNVCNTHKCCNLLVNSTFIRHFALLLTFMICYRTFSISIFQHMQLKTQNTWRSNSQYH